MYGNDRVYKRLEIVGVSSGSIEAAIEAALAKARSPLDRPSWFEVQAVRGHVGPTARWPHTRSCSRAPSQ